MHDRIWLMIDLAVGQDYGGAHGWLAERRAKECGPGLYTLTYDYYGDLLAELSADLGRRVNLAEGDRLYVIYKDADDGEVTGVFLRGQRGPAPWQRTN